MMNTSGKKNKGRIGQQEVRSKINQLFKSILQEDDIKSRPMSSPKEDLMLSPLAQDVLYHDDWEIKFWKRIAIIRWIEQALKREAKRPIVCFRENHGDWYCMMKLDDALELIKGHYHSRKKS
jgi:hypothetical protein